MKRVSKSVGSTPNNQSLEIIKHVRKAVDSHRLLAYADHVIVGVSGGPDSLALLHVLMSLRHELGLKLSAAHFNHRIRRQADRDEHFVRVHAEKLQIPFFCGQASTHPPSHGSLEDWARQERYKFFKRVVLQTKADAIALGHTADDLAETVLMRIIRGSGLQGLAGMEHQRNINGISIIRPFLGIQKKDLYNYLKSSQIPYCIDRTNLKTDFFRNKIRLELLPHLIKEYNPNMMGVLIHLSDTSSMDYSFLETQALHIWKKNVSVKFPLVSMNLKEVRQWDPAMRRIIIRMAYEKLKGDLNQLTFDHVLAVENIILNGNQLAQLPAGILVEKRKQMLQFFKKN